MDRVMDAKRYGVIGTGSWGTALALQLAHQGHDVLVWGRDQASTAQMQTTRQTNRYLPGFALPDNYQIELDFDAVVRAVDYILIVVPSHAFENIIDRLQDSTARQKKNLLGIVSATKGLSSDQELLSDVLRHKWPSHPAFGILSGPTFATEVAKQMPSAITYACENTDAAKSMAHHFHAPHFRVYTHHDLIGVQIGGAVKNVIAMGAGAAAGLGFGANARAALITRGLAEMSRLGLALGAEPLTFSGLAGLGDLILTCTDNQSRNRRFGLLIGEGTDMSQAKTQIDQFVEGVLTAKAIFKLASSHHIEMPITEQIYRVIYDDLSVKQAVENLLTRAASTEF